MLKTLKCDYKKGTDEKVFFEYSDILVLLKLVPKEKFKLGMYMMLIIGLFYRITTIQLGCAVFM